MHCPKCGTHLQRSALEAGSSYVCSHCGWGRDVEDARRASEAGGGSPRISAATWIKLPIFWALTALITLGPYVAVVYGLPWLVERQGWSWVHADPSDLQAKLNPGYWIALAIYIVLAATLRIGVDFNRLGMFGTMRDNPFSFEDDYNRAMLRIALILAPGKIVVFTLTGTFNLLRVLLGGRVT